MFKLNPCQLFGQNNSYTMTQKISVKKNREINKQTQS